MEPVARRPTRRLALGATLASVLIVLAAVTAALWTPGDRGISVTRTPSGQAVVRWVAPNGPAWSADILPGNTIIEWDGTGPMPPTLTVRSGRQSHLLRADATTPALLYVLMAVLSLGWLALGALVLGKSPTVRAAWAYWRLCLLVGLALGVAAAGVHGLGWALTVEFVALRLLGPALLELALVLPIGAEAVRWVSGWRRVLLWLAPAVLLVLYPFCWLWPAPLFTGVQLAGDAVLMGTIIAACGRLLVLWRQPLPEPQQAQLHYLALGVAGGFAPLLLFTLLPALLVRHPLAPPEATIFALVLFPFSTGKAIVRHDFLGIPSLLHRRTLHLVLHGLLLVIMALIVGLLLAPGPQQLGWTRPALAVGATVLLVLFVTQWTRLVQGAEQRLLPDAYDPMALLHQMHEQRFLAEVHEQGTVLLRKVGDDLDLRFAVLQTAQRQYVQGHPREPQPDAVLEVVTQRAQALLTTSPTAESWEEKIEHLPVRVMPVRDREKTVRAVLCIGPKHCGDTFTPQDEEILAVLHDDLEAPFFYRQAEAQFAEEGGEQGEHDDSATGEITLTRREAVVLSLASQGLSTVRIAAWLHRSEGTVRDCLTRAYRKLGVQRREDAVRLASQKQLLLSPTALGLRQGVEDGADDVPAHDNAPRQIERQQDEGTPGKTRRTRRQQKPDS